MDLLFFFFLYFSSSSFLLLRRGAAWCISLDREKEMRVRCSLEIYTGAFSLRVGRCGVYCKRDGLCFSRSEGWFTNNMELYVLIKRRVG